MTLKQKWVVSVVENRRHRSIIPPKSICFYCCSVLVVFTNLTNFIRQFLVPFIIQGTQTEKKELLKYEELFLFNDLYKLIICCNVGRINRCSSVSGLWSLYKIYSVRNNDRVFLFITRGWHACQPPPPPPPSEHGMRHIIYYALY